MFTVNKFLKLLSCSNESELDKMISDLSEEDAKSLIKTFITFLQKQRIDICDL